MSVIEKISHWGDTHQHVWMDVLRVGLGTVIFYKGIEFGRNPQDLNAIIAGSDFTMWSFFLIHYIPMIHMAGGVLIAVGLITRIAILFQLPVLIGAVILNWSSARMLEIYSDFWISLFVLGLLVLFLVSGSGKFSADEYMRKHPGG